MFFLCFWIGVLPSYGNEDSASNFRVKVNTHEKVSNHYPEQSPFFGPSHTRFLFSFLDTSPLSTGNPEDGSTVVVVASSIYGAGGTHPQSVRVSVPLSLIKFFIDLSTLSILILITVSRNFLGWHETYVPTIIPLLLLLRPLLPYSRIGV